MSKWETGTETVSFESHILRLRGVNVRMVHVCVPSRSLLTDHSILKEWDDMTEENRMTIEDLAALAQRGFDVVRGEIQAVDKKIDAVRIHLETRMDRKFEALEERTFDPEEKESMVAASEAYNQQLEDAVLGTKDITLTRSEYDATSVASEFPNRFTDPVGALVD